MPRQVWAAKYGAFPDEAFDRFAEGTRRLDGLKTVRVHETRPRLSHSRSANEIERNFVSPLPPLFNYEPAIEAPSSTAAHALLSSLVGEKQRSNLSRSRGMTEARSNSRVGETARRNEVTDKEMAQIPVRPRE